MAVTVKVPTPLQKYTNNEKDVKCTGSNIAELCHALEQSYPGIKKSLWDKQGRLNRFLLFYVNDEDIRFLEGANTALKDGDEVSIISAVAGG